MPDDSPRVGHTLEVQQTDERGKKPVRTLGRLRCWWSVHSPYERWFLKSSCGYSGSFASSFGHRHMKFPPVLVSFCRKTYKLLINQEKPIIRDQTSDKLERRSGCGFR